jgi:hypothetical protein
MTQKATIAALLAILLTYPASAAAPAGPLTPGQPAGTKNAQLSSKEAIFIGAAALVLGVGLYFASGSYKVPGSGNNTGGGSATPQTLPATTSTH